MTRARIGLPRVSLKRFDTRTLASCTLRSANVFTFSFVPARRSKVKTFIINNLTNTLPASHLLLPDYPSEAVMKLVMVAFMLFSGGGWLFGKPTYLEQPCGKFACERAHRVPMSAQEIWDGGDDQLRVVQAQVRYEDLLPGSLQE